MNFAKFILTILLFIVPILSWSQTSYVYTYTDPCTGLVKSFNVPTNGVTVTYYGQIQTFQPVDFTNGNFNNWANSVFSSYGGNNPCGSILGVSTSVAIAQQTAINFISIINNISAISDLQQSISGGATDILGGAVNSTKTEKKDKKGDKDNSQGGQTNGSNGQSGQTNNQTGSNGQTNNQTGSNGQTNNQTNTNSQTNSNTNVTNSQSGSNSQTNNQSNSANQTGSNSQTNGSNNQSTNSQSNGSNQTGSNNQTSSNGSNNQSNGTNGSNQSTSNSQSNQTGSNNQTNNNQSGSQTNGSNNQSGSGNQSNSQTNGSNEQSGGTNGSNQNSGQNTNQQSSNGNGGDKKAPDNTSGSDATKEEEKKTNILGGTLNSVQNASGKSEGGKPTIVLSSDFSGFNFKDGEVVFGGKGTAGFTSMNWDGTKTHGFLLDYTSVINGPNFTAFYGNIAKRRIDLISLTGTKSFIGRGSFYGTLAVGQMWSFPKVKSLKVIYLATASFGNVYQENFLGTALISGGMYDWKVSKRIDVKMMGLFIYAPYVSYYNDILLKSPYVVMPIIGSNIAITKKFKFNINFGGAYAINENVMNYTLMFGTRMAL